MKGELCVEIMHGTVQRGTRIDNNSFERVDDWCLRRAFLLKKKTLLHQRAACLQLIGFSTPLYFIFFVFLLF